MKENRKYSEETLYAYVNGDLAKDEAMEIRNAAESDQGLKKIIDEFKYLNFEDTKVSNYFLNLSQFPIIFSELNAP